MGRKYKTNLANHMNSKIKEPCSGSHTCTCKVLVRSSPFHCMGVMHAILKTHRELGLS